MKVILVKDCKDGKTNDIIDVSDGYAKNFLFKKGFAISYNSSNEKKLNTLIKEQNEIKKLKHEKALSVKNEIEKLCLTFSLKEINNKIFGSITRKQIVVQLRKKGFSFDNKLIENIKIQSIGTQFVKINITKEVQAKLRVEVKSAK